MRGTVIAIIVIAWIVSLFFVFTKFIAKSIGQDTQESHISSSALLQEQKIKARQAREAQKRRMEAIQRKIREQQRRY